MNSAADNWEERSRLAAETQAAANAGRQAAKASQYQSRVVNPSASGDSWSNEDQHEQRETVRSESDTATGEGGWRLGSNPALRTVGPLQVSFAFHACFMRVACEIHAGFTQVPACGLTFSDGNHTTGAVQLFGQSITIGSPSSSARRSSSASSYSASRAGTTSTEPAPTWTLAQEPNWVP